jgi:ELWxxDGT repeat protein
MIRESNTCQTKAAFMNVKTLGAGLILAGTLVMSGNAGGAQATGTLRPEAVQTSYGSLDLLVDIFSGSNGSNATFGPILNDKMLFSASTATSGNELWVTDGTPTGTTMVKDIYAGSDSSSPRSMTLVGNKVFFQAYDATSGRELWVTDGTADGTVPVKDINPGSNGGYPNDSYPSRFYAFGSQVLFTAETALGQELWITNGTAGGTTMVKDINTVSTHSSPRGFTEFNGKVYFSANDGINGTELWVTDGTANGTTLVKDIYIGASSSEVSDLIVFQGKLFFEANNAATGYEMWSSDGTPGGTTLFKDIRPGSDSSNLHYPIVLGDKLLFMADDGTNGYELWSSDGTPTGTTMLKDIYTGSNSGSPSYMIKIGDFVYFFANDATTGVEPWKSDGTSSGTVRIADIRTGPNGSFSCCGEYARFRQYGETVMIVADDGVNGAEPWISGGSITGANLLSDVRPGSSGSLGEGGGPGMGEAPQSAVVGGKYLFTADNGQVGTEIWMFSSPPGAPTTVTATPSTNSAIVSWTAPTSTSNVSSYTVTSNPGAFTCTTATLSCTVTGLLANQDYTFTVVATSTVGSGPASAVSPRVRTLSPQLGSLLNSLTAVTNIISDNDFTPGESFTAFYTGFNANEMVLMVMASNPVVIGSTNADANGNVAITGVIPSNATVGNHTLALYAPVSGFGAKQAITVTNSVPASGSGGSTSGASSTPSVDPSTLPATGQGSNPSLLAYLLLVVGIGLLAGRRIVAPLARDRQR